jgi:serine/threonine protein phosphatase PrpC
VSVDPTLRQGSDRTQLIAQGVAQLSVAAQTDPGCDPEKALNEDSYVIARGACGTCLAVCDGMGGHDGGRVASVTASQVLQSLIEAAPPDAACAHMLRRAVETAGRAVYALATPNDDALRPGSTCVAFLAGRATAYIAHVGDSRAYRLRNGALERLTQDHSLVNDLVLAGEMTPAEAAHHPEAHRLTRALGMSAQVVVDVCEQTLLKDDCFLLCSDGLTDLVSDIDITGILADRSQPDLQLKCAALIALAKKRGGHDNVTAVVACIVDPGESISALLPAPGVASSRTSAMSAPSLASDAAPVRTTVDLASAAAKAIMPTVIETGRSLQRTADTQPISAGTLTPATKKMRFEPRQARGDGSPTAPRSSVRWVILSAVLCGLVFVWLAVWALLR